jgi:hypothetical protein
MPLRSAQNTGWEIIIRNLAKNLVVTTHDRAEDCLGFGFIGEFRRCDRVGWAFSFAATAYNLKRLPKLLACRAPRTASPRMKDPARGDRG